MTVEGDGVVAGRPGLLRAINEAILVTAMRRNGPMARPDLTRLSGLSKPTVGFALAKLEEDGLIRLAGRRTGLRGPAAALYEVHPEAGFVLALDVGSEYVHGAVADLSGAARARGSRSVHAASSHARMSGLAALADELLAEVGLRRRDVLQTIVGSPGVYDPVRDVVTLARGLPGWEQPGVLAELRRAFGAATVVENDVNLATLAEREHGHGRGVDSFAFVSIGRGLGMGVVLGRQLYTGTHGGAGEIAYLPIGERSAGSADARRRGALEVAAGAAGVVRAARREGMGGRLTARRVFELARAGDQRARRVVLREATLVAEAIASVSTVLDPRLVVLGGGIGGAPGFAEQVADRLAELVPFAPDVQTSALGSEGILDGGIVAGVDRAWERVLDRS